MQNLLKRISQFAITALLLAQALPVLAVTYTSTNFQVVDPEIQTGGVGTSSSTNFSVIGTLGETAIGRATSASFTSTAGSLGYPRCTTPTLTATAAGAGTIALSWTAATCTGGWTLASYQYCEGTAADTYASCTGNSTNLTVNDTATPGVLTFYRVRVIATGAGSSGTPAGNVGSRSNEVSITPTGSGGAGGGGGGGGGGGAATTTLSLTIPNGGETLEAGTTQNITWQSTGTINTVALFLSSDGGLSFPTIIATNESNDGTYAWAVPNLTGAQFRVRIEGRTSTGVVLISDISNGNFSIGPRGAIPEPAPTPAAAPSGPPRTSDLNADSRVNLTDFSLLLAWYRKPNAPEQFDLNRDGVVNLRDVSVMIFNWRV